MCLLPAIANSFSVFIMPAVDPCGVAADVWQGKTMTGREGKPLRRATQKGRSRVILK